jgi:hypothetical protein
MRIAQQLFRIIIYIILLSGAASGIFSSVGICVFIWGSSVVNRLSNPPDYSHPAIWTMIALMPPLIIIGFLGSLSAICLPLCIFFPEVSRFNGKGNLSDLKFLRWGLRAALKYVNSERQRLTKRPKL